METTVTELEAVKTAALGRIAELEEEIERMRAREARLVRAVAEINEAAGALLRELAGQRGASDE